MIVMGAGTNHWMHSDLIYRAMLGMVLLCGCQGVNGGGWAHYVGQEKVRPITGFSQVAFALDWSRPPRHQAATPFWYLATEQYRYEAFAADELASPTGEGTLAGAHFADLYAKAARMGWLPAYPASTATPSTSTAAAAAEGVPAAEYAVRELVAGRLRFAAEDPGAPENFPRVLTLWRSNLLGSSSKGHEHFLKHLLGVTTAAVRGDESPPELRPRDVVWRDEAAEAKLDLLITHRLPDERLLPALGHRAPRSHLVREARHLEHGPAPVRARVHPGHRAAVGGAHGLGHLRPRRGVVLAPGGDAPRLAHRPRRRPAPARHARRARPDRRAGARLEARRVRADPGPDHAEADPRRARLPGAPRPDDGPRPPGGVGGDRRKGVSWTPGARSRSSRSGTAASAAARPTGGADGAGRPGVRDDPHAVRDHERAPALEGFRPLEARTGTPLADLASEHVDDAPSPTSDTAGPAAQGHRLARVVGAWRAASARTRSSRSTSSASAPVPDAHRAASTSTSTTPGCSSTGEGLPAYRPPLNLGAARWAPQGDRRRGRRGHAPLPDAALEVVDPLRVPGQPAHADPVPGRARDLAEPDDAARDRRGRQRLGRGLQPQRRRRLPGGRVAPHPGGDVRLCTTPRTGT